MNPMGAVLRCGREKLGHPSLASALGPGTDSQPVLVQTSLLVQQTCRSCGNVVGHMGLFAYFSHSTATPGRVLSHRPLRSKQVLMAKPVRSQWIQDTLPVPRFFLHVCLCALLPPHTHTHSNSSTEIKLLCEVWDFILLWLFLSPLVCSHPHPRAFCPGTVSGEMEERALAARLDLRLGLDVALSPESLWAGLSVGWTLTYPRLWSGPQSLHLEGVMVMAPLRKGVGKMGSHHACHVLGT